MLQLNALIDQHCPKEVEQRLIEQYVSFAEQNGVNQQTAQQSLVWILKYMRFHNGTHPSDLNQYDVAAFLSALAIQQQASPKTQRQALSTLSSFYKEFIKVDFKVIEYAKLKYRRGFADRFSSSDCISLIDKLSGSSQLMAKLAYYCQLKLHQVAHLRVSDIDLKSGTVDILDKHHQLKFKASIPLTLHLDLRIQKMRAEQINQRINQRINCQLKGSNQTNNSAQYGLFKQQANLLFVLSELTKHSEITAESQLAILKSEIKVAVNQIKNSREQFKINISRSRLSGGKTINRTRNKLTGSSQIQASIYSRTPSARIMLTKTSNNQPTNSLRTIVGQSNYHPRINNYQKDFFDLGAA
jgi:hypothetical protein